MGVAFSILAFMAIFAICLTLTGSFQSQITNGKSPVSRGYPTPRLPKDYQKTTGRLPRQPISFQGQRPFWLFQAYPKRIPKGVIMFSLPLYCLYIPSRGVCMDRQKLIVAFSQSAKTLNFVASHNVRRQYACRGSNYQITNLPNYQIGWPPFFVH